jgi:hypothetical protein
MEVATRTERMRQGTPRVDWAEVLRRTFDFDVFSCVRCGGRRWQSNPLPEPSRHEERYRALAVHERGATVTV